MNPASRLRDWSIVHSPCMADPSKYGLPVEASGLALVTTWAGDQVVTAAVDPAALDLARLAFGLDDDGTTVTMPIKFTHWLALGTPNTWGPCPTWAPLTPRPEVDHG